MAFLPHLERGDFCSLSHDWSEEILEKKGSDTNPASFDDSWRFPNSSTSEIPEKCHFTDSVCEAFIVRKPSLFLCQKVYSS